MRLIQYEDKKIINQKRFVRKEKIGRNIMKQIKQNLDKLIFNAINQKASK